MENSQQPLAIESFSYSWLSSDINSHSSSSSSSYHGYIDNLCKDYNNNFDFDIHFSAASPINLAHADEIFSDGHIKPVSVDRSSSRENSTTGFIRKASISVPSSPVPPYVSDASKSYQYYEIGKWKRIFQRCFKFVMKRPLYNTLGGVRCSRKSSRVDDLERKVCEAHQSWSNSVAASPSLCSDYSVRDMKKIDSKIDLIYGLKKIKSWSSSSPQANYYSPRISPSRSCNNNPWSSDADEISIHEAILYCKRSIEK